MILTDLKKSTAEKIGEFFSDPSIGCPVFWQNQKEKEEKKALATARAFQAALADKGAAIMVMNPTLSMESDHTICKAHLSILVVENVFKNRSTDGTGITAFEFAEMALAVLVTEQLAPWSQFFFEHLNDNVEIEMEGHEGWLLTVNCTTLLDTVIAVLADELGTLIATENNELISTEP